MRNTSCRNVSIDLLFLSLYVYNHVQHTEGLQEETVSICTTHEGGTREAVRCRQAKAMLADGVIRWCTVQPPVSQPNWTPKAPLINFFFFINNSLVVMNPQTIIIQLHSSIRQLSACSSSLFLFSRSHICNDWQLLYCWRSSDKLPVQHQTADRHNIVEHLAA